jgi:hypothetical protein
VENQGDSWEDWPEEMDPWDAWPEELDPWEEWPEELDPWDTWEDAAPQPKPQPPVRSSRGRTGTKKVKKVKKNSKGGAPEGNKNASQSLLRYVKQNYPREVRSNIDVIWWLQENEEKLAGCKGDFFSEKTFEGDIRKNLEYNDAIENGFNQEYICLD